MQQLSKYKKTELGDIPEDWDILRLEEVCSIRKTNNVKSELYVGLEHIGQGNNQLVGRGNVIDFTSTKNVFLKGDVLYGKLRPLLNKVYLAEEDGYCSTDILPLVSNDKISNKILLMTLTSERFVNYADANSSGTKMPRTNWNDMKNFVIPIGKIKEQQKIASILSNVDALIQKTDQIIEQTRILKKGLMQRLLTKGIGHTKFKKTEFTSSFIKYNIPEDWIVDTVKNLSTKLVVSYVGTCDPYYTDNNGIPMLRTTNVKEGYIDLSNLKYVTKEFHEKNKKSQLQENDLIIARHGENGTACLVRGIKEANALSVVIVRPDPKIWIPDFFELAFNSNIVRKQIGKNTAGGVQTVVNTAEVGKALICLPSKDEQSKIVSIFSTVKDFYNKISQEHDNLIKLKKGLMQQLLTGKIRVKV